MPHFSLKMHHIQFSAGAQTPLAELTAFLGPPNWIWGNRKREGKGEREEIENGRERREGKVGGTGKENEYMEGRNGEGKGKGGRGTARGWRKLLYEADGIDAADGLRPAASISTSRDKIKATMIE